MKFNLFTIFCIILLAILTFGAVNASDDAFDNNLTIADGGNVTLSVDGIDTNQEEVISQNSSDLTLSEKIVTPDNIGDFEDDIIPAGEYKFTGTFANTSSFVLFDDGCVVDASEAEFKDMAVIVQGNVMLKGLTLTSTICYDNGLSSGGLIYVTGENNCLQDLTINYSPQQGTDAYALYVSGANNFTLLNSKINFTSTDLTSHYRYAVKIISSQLGLIKGNVIRANLPILDVDYENSNPGLDTDYVLNTGIKECSDFDIIENRFFANVIGRNGNFPTLDCMMLESCSRVNIIGNAFNETDFFTAKGNPNFLNVLDMYYSSDVLVQNNNISVETTGGSENEGTSYPIQITGPYENVVVDENRIYAYCEGPALGIYSQNYYGDTEILVQNNKINITGLPTLKYNGLVSGIELQDNVARVYNNDIKTRSITGSYQDGANLYGISYAQALKDNHNYDIQDNVIETQGKYSIYLLKVQDIIISNNSLVSSYGEGDSTIYINKTEGTVNISGNYGREKTGGENVVTPDNFFEFFNDDGELKEDIQFDELIFKGEFDNILPFILIVNPVSITGDNAVLKNMRVLIYSDDVELDNLNFIADTPLESLIYIQGSYVNLTNSNITYSASNEDALAVDIYVANSVYLYNNNLFFESHVTSDENKGIGLQVQYSQDIVIDNNRITTKLPCILVNEYDDDYYVMGSNNVNPVRLKGCNNLKFTRNLVNSTTNDCTAEFPTIQSIYIIGCSNSIIDHNNISMIDEFTPEGMDNYMYGIDFAFNTNVTFSYNNFVMITKGGKDAAGTNYAFQGVRSDVIIRGNHIVTKSNGPNIGIYVTSTGGETSDILIEDNFINVTGSASSSGNWALVTAIEIQNGNAKIYNNTIYTYNVNEYDDAAYFFGISYAQYMFGNRSFDIRGNTVYSGGKYSISIIDADYLYVIDNTLFARNLTGDESVNPGNCANVYFIDNSTSDKLDANIIIEVPDSIKVGETVIINVTADTTSDLVVSIDGENVNFVNGKVTYQFSKGNLHTINVFAGENEDYYLGNETQVINVSKCDAVIILNQFDNVKVGDVISITPQTNSDGAVTIKINGEVIEGDYTVSSNGTYTITAESAETDMYNAGFNSTCFVVFKDASSIDVTFVPARSGETSLINVDVTEGASGKVIVNVNGTEYPVNISDGKLELVLDAGEYLVFAKYMGDDKFNASVSETKTLTVLDKLDVNVNIGVLREVKVGDSVVINVTADTTSDLVVTIDGVNVNVVDGKVTYNVTNAGSHYINVFAGENKDYKLANVTESFNASKYDSFIILNQFDNVKVGDVIAITPQTNSNGALTIKVNDEVVIDNYTVRINGTYTITVESAETDMYKQGFNSTSFTVFKDVSTVNVTVNPAVAMDETTITVKVTEGVTGEIIVKLNGTEVYKGPANETDAVSLGNLAAGSYIVNVDYMGDVRYNGSSDSMQFTVFKSQSSIKADSIEFIEGEIAKLTVNVNEGSTGRVLVVINSNKYYGDILNNTAIVNITNLSAGHYDVNITYLGDGRYDSSSNITTVIVKKLLSSNDLDINIVQTSSSVKLTIKLPGDATGNVTIKVDGNSYIKELDNGVATLTISNLKASKHTVDVNYPGDYKYTAVSKSETFQIKSQAKVKSTTKFEAKNKAFKVKTKVKKYTVTLKSGKTPVKNVKVTLKVKGKTYNAKTNNKGKATFKIKKLNKKGKYSATIKFSGNASYKNAVKSVKITVRK